MSTLSIAFDAVYVIESLKPSERHTGWNVYDEILKPRAAEHAGFEVRYWAARTRGDFHGALREVHEQCLAGRVPILHLEAHGAEDGLYLADGTVVAWPELREPLTDINVATRCQLVVVAAMCHGAYLVNAMRFGEPTPVAGVIGADVKVDDIPMEDGLWLMYEELFAGGTGDTSLAALNAAQRDRAQRYYVLTAEELLLRVVTQFFESRTPEVQRAHVEALVAASVARHKKAKDPVAVAQKARVVAEACVGDACYWYTKWRERFLMLDRFPENASRFTLTYNDYLASRRET